MPVLEKKKKAAPVIDAAEHTSVAPGNRIIKMELPVLKKLTPEQIEDIEVSEGQEVLAICDFTGEPIFKEHNINKIDNKARPELHGKVMSTKFLTNLLLATTGSKVTLAKVGKPRHASDAK